MIVILSAAIVMTMAVAERTREIGTLRAMGTRPAGILRLFLAEGTALAIAGCTAGMLLALLIRAILNASGIILPPPPGATHGMPIHVQFFPLAYAAGFLAMIATMAVASYFRPPGEHRGFRSSKRSRTFEERCQVGGVRGNAGVGFQVSGVRVSQAPVPDTRHQAPDTCFCPGTCNLTPGIR